MPGPDEGKGGQALRGLRHWIEATFPFRQGVGAPRLGLGPYANVIDLGDGRGMALCTDGVGTKVLVAQMLDRYDTIGIDCVAMNVNDLICLGAEPLSLVDYIALEEQDPAFLEALARGLHEGARQAGVAIVGGEVAQLPEIIKGQRPGRGFDLAAAAVGIVPLDRLILGQDVRPGDALVGLASSGIHSNGLTLARRVLFGERGLDPLAPHHELGRSMAEELLEPTRIYVTPVLETLRSGLHVKALFHITGEGFLNLTRHRSEVDWDIDHLPETPPIFSLIQRYGQISDREMYATFNMGTGFCLAVPPDEVGRLVEIAQRHEIDALLMGRAAPQVGPRRRVVIEPKGIELGL